MALTDFQYEQIDKYLSGLLSPDEEAFFLKEVAADDAWHTEFEFQKLIHGKQDVYEGLPAFINAAAQETEAFRKDRERIAEIANLLAHPEKKEQTAKVISIGAKRMLIAASVLAFIITAAVFINKFRNGDNNIAIKPVDKNKEDTNTKNKAPDNNTERNTLLLAYEKNYSVYEPGDNIPPELQNPVVNYNLKKYQQASNELNEIASSGTRGGGNDAKKIATYASFYKGLCLIETGNDAGALKALGNAYASRNNATKIQDDIAWYYALACLKANQKDEAIKALSALTTQPGKSKKYYDKAAAIISQLK